MVTYSVVIFFQTLFSTDIQTWFVGGLCHDKTETNMILVILYISNALVLCGWVM